MHGFGKFRFANLDISEGGPEISKDKQKDEVGMRTYTI